VLAKMAAAESAALTAQFGPTGNRAHSLVDYPRYMDMMARLIGRRPRLGRLALNDRARSCM
jgi:hypothetical protein